MSDAEGGAGGALRKKGKATMVERRRELRVAEKAQEKELRSKMKKYKKDGEEGRETRYKVEPDQPARLKSSLKKAKRMRDEALRSAARAEMVHNTDAPGFIELDEGEHGRDITQKDVLQHADVQTQRKRFDVTLDKLGPYRHTYSVNGNSLALGGEKGHLAFFEWKKFKLFGEGQLRDRVADLTFLVDDTLLGVAQKKYVYIYNNKASEIHLLKNMQNIRSLAFLPQHMLLTAVGTQGVLQYFDVSIGETVSVQKTKLGPCEVSRRNPWNSVMALGHTLGTVTHWSPSCSAPLVKVLAHNAPLVDIAFTLDGKQMVTAGADSMVKVWDTRMWKSLHNIPQRSVPTSLDVSQTDLLSVASGPSVEVWKDWTKKKPFEPYMYHRLPNVQDVISRARFCPYEDVLGVSHSSGFSSMLVPGAGEANYDYYVANPYETKQQRKERPVHQLLDKLPPDMITLNPRDLGMVNTRKMQSRKEQQKLREKQAADALERQAKNGVAEEDAASDEDGIVRPESRPEGRRTAKIRRPKHLKEKRLYLQKQEHKAFLAKKAARQRVAEREKQKREGRSGDGGGGDGDGDVQVADKSVFDDKPVLGSKRPASEEVLPNEPGMRKRKRKKVEPKKRTALDALFDKKAEYAHAAKNVRR